MPCIKAFFLLKMGKDGNLRCYFQRNGNYDDCKDLMASGGYRDWQHVQAGKPDELPGFCAIQMRPYSRLEQRRDRAIFPEADYELPFSKWKFNIKHTPVSFQVPDWVHVGSIRAECMKRLPEWATTHLIRRRKYFCKEGMAIAALTDSKVLQDGGTCWGYKNAAVIQQPGAFSKTYLHDHATGLIRSMAWAYNSARVDVFPSAGVKAHDNAVVVLRPGPKGELGRFTAYSPAVRVYRVRPRTMLSDDRPARPCDLLPVEFTPEDPTPGPAVPVGAVQCPPFGGETE